MEGGRDHMVRDVSGCGVDGRSPPPPGRGASLWFAISAVFNLRDKGSAGTTFNHSLS